MGISTEKRAETKSISLRLEAPVVSSLRREAGNKEITLNTLCSQIFRTHVGFTGNAAKAGLIPFPRALLIGLMDKLSDEEIQILAEDIATNEVPDIIYLMRDRYDSDSFLEVLVSWVRASGFPFNFNTSNDKRVLVIQHDMTRKWSLYLAKMCERVCYDLKGAKPEFQITKNTLVIGL